MEKRKAILIICVSLFVLLIGLGSSIFLATGNQQEYIVTDVYIQTELNSELTDNGYRTTTKYLYFCMIDTGEEIVFENEDNIFFWKWNSSDILAKIRKCEQNKTHFKIKTAGFRIGFLSVYQNIIEVIEA